MRPGSRQITIRRSKRSLLPGDRHARTSADLKKLETLAMTLNVGVFGVFDHGEPLDQLTNSIVKRVFGAKSRAL